MPTPRQILHQSHWGMFHAEVENGRLTGVRPHHMDPAPSEMIASITEWANPEHRVLHPRIRRGWLDAHERGRPDTNRDGRGHDEFLRVPWDEAIDVVAGEIRRVRDDFGPASIFAGSYGWASAGRFHHAASQLKRMLGLAGGYTGHFDTYSIAAGPVLTKLVLGDREVCAGRGTTLDTVVASTKTLLVFGAISPRTAQNEAGGLGQHRIDGYLRGLAERNVQVKLISPCRDDLPEHVSAQWLPIRPGTDAALLLALSAEVFLTGRADEAFLERYCSGVAPFRDYLTGRADGTRRDAGWAAPITGIPAETIRDLAHQVSKTRTMISLSWSLQRARFGEQAYWAAIALASVTGQIGLSGGGFAFGFGSVGGNGAPYGFTRSPALPSVENPADSAIPVARVTDMLLNPGEEYSYFGEVRRYPDVRLVYWAGGNPFHHHQDLRRLERAWQRPETIIIQDPVPTATVERADIVLPACSTLERADIAGSRRYEYIVAMKPVIAPMGEARSDYVIVGAIAEALGIGAAFSEGRTEMEWLEHIYQRSREDVEEKTGRELPDFGTFWEQGMVEVPMLEGRTYLDTFRQNPEGAPLATESGRIVLFSPKVAAGAEVGFAPHPAWFEPEEEALPDTLHLLSPQPGGRLHSQLGTGPSSRKRKLHGLERLRIHPKDAAARDLEDGERVVVFNERGRCLAALDVTADVMPGVVCLPTGSHLRFDPAQQGDLEISGNPNVLTRDVPASSFSQGCAAQTCRVRICKAE
ncbi:MAG: molybdopterin-dependent oxidoreductase [Tropicimonas sp.]|uniref:molybdopterin-dependent oxidoreductase n=1 Tax=Tropicimonas sp. TaxID=2067044 RepID=UPI003A839DF4